MNIVDIRAQMEEELTWRQNEIRFLRNQLSYISADQDKRRYRKSLVVMLYAHFEGFCKTVLLIYVDAINHLGIKRNEANPYIKTASLADVFKAYGNLDKKCALFKNALPQDEKLHLFSRQVDFVNMIDALWQETAEIPESVVDTESNLKPVVLRKILFRLGFPYDCFAGYEGKINFLLEKRNSIAHGSGKEGLEEKEYSEVETASFTVMEKILKLVIEALENKTYLSVV